MGVKGGMVRPHFLLLVAGGSVLGLPQEPLSSAINFPGSEVEAKASAFVDDAEKQLEADAIESTFASWNYESNITDHNQQISLAASKKSGLLAKKLGKEAQAFDLTQVKSEDVRRKLKLMRNLGTSALSEAKLERFNQLVSDMGSTYSKAKVTQRRGSDLWSLEPELTEIMASGRDPDELQYYWEQWREKSGKMIKGNYHEYIDLYNEAAKLNGFSDASMMKVDPYESKTFIQEMEDTWQGLKPLYEKLHAYVRNKQCTRVNQEDFITVNHEMGHIQYFLQYSKQSYFFRTGANPGFHEGVADILSLAVGTAE